MEPHGLAVYFDELVAAKKIAPMSFAIVLVAVRFVERKLVVRAERTRLLEAV